MDYLTTKTKQELQEAIKMFGFDDEKEFISRAVKEKLMELKKLQFFLISEKVRRGLAQKGIEPKDVLREVKT